MPRVLLDMARSPAPSAQPGDARPNRAAEPLPADRAREEDASPRALPWPELFESFFARDPERAAAATAVFARLIRFWLYRLGARGERVDFDDLVQDVLLELARARAAIDDPSALGGWLRTTTARKLQDRWRSAQRSPHAQGGESLGSLADPALLPDQEVQRKEDRAELARAIDRLPPALRACVRLQLRGLSEDEIAEQLRPRARLWGSRPIRRHSVKNWLRRARLELRRTLLEGPR